MPKKVFAAALAVLLAAVLSACSMLYDESVGDNIGPFVDPEANPAEDYLPPSNAPSIQPAEQPGGEEEPANPRVTEPPIDEEGYYIGDGFRFYVPLLWRSRMQIEIKEEIDREFPVTVYDFYYVAEDASEIKVMTLKTAPYEFYLEYGDDDGTHATAVEPEKPVYILKGIEGELPAGFTDVDGFIEINSVLTDVSRFDFQRVDPAEDAADPGAAE